MGLIPMMPSSLRRIPLGELFLFFSYFSLLGVVVMCQSDAGSGSVEERIKAFLASRCNSRNQTLEQEEYETFASCNPTMSAMILKSIDPYSKERDASVRVASIRRQIQTYCGDWDVKRGCQKRNFKLIEKCFDGQQKFVFYFLIALGDTICRDPDPFIGFWENGGNKCLPDHLTKLTQEISDCLTATETTNKDDLDKNIEKVTECIGQKFSDCRNQNVIYNLMGDIKTFYYEIKNAALTSAAPASSSFNKGIQILLPLSFTLSVSLSLPLLFGVRPSFR